MLDNNIGKEQILKDTFEFQELEKIFLKALEYHKRNVNEFEYLFSNTRYKIFIELIESEYVLKNYSKPNCKHCFGKGYLIVYMAKSNKQILNKFYHIVSEDNKMWKTQQVCSCVVKKAFDNSIYSDKYYEYFLKLFMEKIKKENIEITNQKYIETIDQKENETVNQKEDGEKTNEL